MPHSTTHENKTTIYSDKISLQFNQDYQWIFLYQTNFCFTNFFLVQLKRVSRNCQAVLRNYPQRYEMQINTNLTLQKNNDIINSLSRGGFELASSGIQSTSSPTEPSSQLRLVVSFIQFKYRLYIRNIFVST